MKVTITIITGCAPNLPYARVMSMTDEEIRAFNEQFYRRETVECEIDEADLFPRIADKLVAVGGPGQ